ncbi:MAG: hypothetical protein J7L22_03900 [Candidatus Marinimicrobia bacterium]|nr:hypothetical protein [Candidatus Neomarinimicrobiota bacterium]RKY60991.1 MAG: hypothetical protein DRP96_04440 [Candidatus Neomarinimicrobiota bacterium]
MKNILSGFCVICLFSAAGLSLENEDSLYVHYSPYLNPEYHYGVEFNPGLLLYAIDDEATVISAGFSLFPKNRKTELTVPIIFENTKDDQWFGGIYSGTSLNIGLHYRRFLTGKVGGAYTSIGIKYNYAYLRSEDDCETDFTKIVSRLGAGFGIGYRVFSDERIYWGIGIFLGSYLLGRDISDTINVSSMFTRDEMSIITIQILKVGFAF